MNPDTGKIYIRKNKLLIKITFSTVDSFIEASLFAYL
jgi:hypothetical protein